ncbi:a-glycosyltransferase, glycosyltransferase family 4 protein [Pedobacter sp. BAL39]|nr:a-glycosyltransferase, glycosyltransferase family 4 protein [Pedobacter sp. BAL39]
MFGAPGGIQRVNRIMSYAIDQLSIKNSWLLRVLACYDQPSDLISKYLPAQRYFAFSSNRFWFSLSAIWQGLRSDTLILTHINLSPVARIIHIVNPGCKILLVAHGIEVWKPLTGSKRKICQIANKILCVSQFTRDKMVGLQSVSVDKCQVLNNPLDPFMALPRSFEKPQAMLSDLHIRPTDKVMLTLSRITPNETFKGYTQVIGAMAQLHKEIPSLKYILAGPIEMTEKENILQLLSRHKLEKQVMLTGYIKEEDLAMLFLSADLFVLPSKKEGFGLVFIEAMAHGLPVICGNKDGSLDAVRHPAMGTAIDPDDVPALCEALKLRLAHPATTAEKKEIQRQCLEHFNIHNYTIQLEKLIHHATTD